MKPRGIRKRMANFVIMGCGGHGRVVMDIVEKARQYILVRIMDANGAVRDNVLGHEVVGHPNDLAT